MVSAAIMCIQVFFFNDTATTEIYTLSLHDALPISVPVTPGFAPGETDLGSVMFICNNPKHGDYECVLPLCRVCGKMKKFGYDYSAKCWRCSVCKREFPVAQMKCDRCGDPPGPRTRIRMKRN